MMGAPAEKKPRVYGKFAIRSQGLYLGSQPVERALPLLLEGTDSGERRLLCRRYTNCLTWAASQGWRGFACVSCGVVEQMATEDQYQDLEGLAALLTAIASRRRP